MRSLLGRFHRPNSRSQSEQLFMLNNLGDGSTLSLDFTTGVLDPRLTFTRAGGGTYVGPDGYIYGIDSATSSSLAIGTGSKSVTLTATADVNRRFEVGQKVYFSNGANNMSGLVTAYSPSTQVITINATSTSGSGSFTSWFVGNASARFDYDPSTLTPRGLLIEASANNLAANSNLQAAWLGGSNTTVTANTSEVASPDGTNNAAKIALTNTGYCSRFESITGLANATTYTFSYWIRGTAGNQQRVYSVTQGIDLVTQSNLTYTTTGWTRVQIQFTSGAASNNVYIYVASRPSGTVNDVIYVYGCQLEVGTGASSLIPTGASTGNRAADSFVMTGTNFSSWFAGATEGVLYAEFEKPRSQSGTIGHDHSAVGSRYASGNGFNVYAGYNNYYPTTLLWPTGGAIFPGGIASAIPSVTKQAGKWFGGNDATNFANGVQGTTSAGTGTLTPTMLSIGANSATGTEATRDWLNACVRRVKFWPTALPDSQIISITT